MAAFISLAASRCRSSSSTAGSKILPAADENKVEPGEALS